MPTDPRNRYHQKNESTRVELARRLDGVNETLADVVRDRAVGGDGLGVVSFTAQELLRRYTLYKSAAVGQTRNSVLPAATQPAAVVIDRVTPDVGFSNAPTVLAVQGSGFMFKGEPFVKQVMVGGVRCDVEVIGSNALLAVVPAGAFREPATQPAGPGGLPPPARPPAQPQTLSAVSRRSVVSVATQPIVFSRERDAKLEPALPAVAVTRDAIGRVTSVTIAGDATLAPADLLAAIQNVLRGEKCCEGVSVVVTTGRGTPAPATQPTTLPTAAGPG
jgi:hypothetical protein